MTICHSLPSVGRVTPVTEFKITYKNGDRQTIRARTYKVGSGFFVFADEQGPVLTVPVETVESISRGDVAERERPLPVTA